MELIYYLLAIASIIVVIGVLYLLYFIAEFFETDLLSFVFLLAVGISIVYIVAKLWQLSLTVEIDTVTPKL